MKAMIIIPTYNEADNLEKIIGQILEVKPDFYITVVDDNSPDGTGRIADQLSQANPRIQVIHRAQKSGLGTAYLEGFRFALAQGMDYIFEMDADFSHHPQYLLDMLDRIQDCDLVLGSRYLHGVRVNNWAFRRLLLSKMANLYVQFIAPLPIEDSTGGFKCFRRRVLEAINLDRIHSDGYCFQIEMTYRAFKKGFRIEEIPIIFYERQGGYSKMSRHIIFEAFWLVLKLRLGFIRN